MLASTIAAGTPVIACAKGIEHGTHKFMTEVIAESVPQALPAILSGPSFAVDVAQGLPTAVTLAARDGEIAAKLARSLGSAAFRLYHTDDTRGVEINHGFAERTTFVVNKDGKVAEVIGGVSPAENVQKSLEAVQRLVLK